MIAEIIGKWIFIIIAFLCIPTCLVAAEYKPEQVLPVEEGDTADRQVEWGFWVQDYKWAEYAENGDRLLEETGLLYTIAYDFEALDNPIGLRNGVNFFWGEVDYDGQTWTGIPVKSEVTNFGTNIYLDMVPNYRFQSGPLLKGFLGIGGRVWYRDIDSSQTATGIFVRGSEEWWWCLFGRIGGGLAYPVSEDVDIYTEAGLKIPVYARNDANFFMTKAPSASLEPKQRVSAFGHIGLRWVYVTLTLAYDSLRFDTSDTVSSGFYELQQPESKADIYSLELSWLYRF